MKKIFAIVIALTLALMLCAAATAEGESWYELSVDGTVLTVTLPANPTTGYQWEDSISDETVLEMITCEYTQDEGAENLLGAGGTFVASYRGIAEGYVLLEMDYMGPGADSPEDTYALMLNVDAEGKITVDSVITDTPSADEWMELDPDAGVATAHLMANTADGYFWTFEISDPEVIELLVDGYDDPDTAACAENGYAASFRVIGQSDEEQTITFSYGLATEEGIAMPSEIRVADMYVNEAGKLEITGLETITYEQFMAE